MLGVLALNLRLSAVSRRWLPRLLILLAMAVPAIVVLTPDVAHVRGAACQRRDTWVALTPAASERYRVVGWLCRPSRPASIVQVLMSGFTYDHTYWDLAGEGQSYVRAALRAGMAVYTVDRIGAGASDRPPSDQVTVVTEAFVAHQLVQQLRHDGGFRRVIGVGHSYGSAIWMVEAADHHDVDALVLTGYLHQANPAQQAVIAAGLHPAGEDAAFAGDPPPDGYVTTQPGTRSASFYYLLRSPWTSAPKRSGPPDSGPP